MIKSLLDHECVIRPYMSEDFPMIHSWWMAHKEVPPIPGMMTEDGTFVLEYDGAPIMTLSVLLTQSPEVSYFEGFCSKPGLDKKISHHAGQILWDYCYQFLVLNGFNRVIILTNKESLISRYKELGMTEYVKGLTSLGRKL